MHQVVTAYLAGARQGTRAHKNRAAVSGGGAKPYRQKGTGRARQGTTRANQFAGGGVPFGPKAAVIGVNGSGKSSLLALIEGRLEADAGAEFRGSIAPRTDRQHASGTIEKPRHQAGSSSLFQDGRTQPGRQCEGPAGPEHDQKCAGSWRD